LGPIVPYLNVIIFVNVLLAVLCCGDADVVSAMDDGSDFDVAELSLGHRWIR
jgi:hypothetical protein